MADASLQFRSATELAELIRRKHISPVEVVKELLARIQQINPRLNAYVTLQEGEALCAAQRAEAAVMRGERLSPLHGVPFHVKDNLWVRGSRTTFGSRLSETNITATDSPAVERLRNAGLILLGRTNTPEQGWKGVTDNRVFGITRNPWNRELTPGGSSGGAAAAVAAGLGPIGLGTDGGGSLRIPASFCHVFGFKASFGRVPNWPGSSGALLRHIGAITRTVADMAATLDLIAGPDARDMLSLPGPPLRWSDALQQGVKQLRIGYSPNLGYAAVDPEVAAICLKAARKFTDTDAQFSEVQLDWTDPYETWSVFFFGTIASLLESKLASHGDQLDPGLKTVVERGRSLRGVDFGQALAARHAFWEKVRATFENYDLILCPTLAVPPFPVGQDDAAPLNGETFGPLQWTRFTYPFNLTGQPAASVPAGWTKSGLPVGLQIIGGLHADLQVLQAARVWEQLSPWQDRKPEV